MAKMNKAIFDMKSFVEGRVMECMGRREKREEGMSEVLNEGKISTGFSVLVIFRSTI